MSMELTTTQILEGLTTVRSVLAPELSPDELRLFAMVANRSGLDPFAKQIYAVKRKGRVTFQTGIDGYRSIAARTGLYDGQDEPEFGPVCACGDKRPEGHPEWATVRVYRKGVGRAIAATAYWHEYKPAMGDRERPQDGMWVRMPRVMLGKVAEALALRKAFPYDPDRREGIGADLYTAEEMAQAGRQDASPAPTVERPATAAARIAARREAMAQPSEPVVVVEALAAEAPTTDEIEAIADEIVDGELVEQPAPMARGTFNAAAVASHVTKADVAAARERLGIAADDQSEEAYGRLADFLGVRP